MYCSLRPPLSAIAAPHPPPPLTSELASCNFFVAVLLITCNAPCSLFASRPPAIRTAQPAFSQPDHSLTQSVFNPNGPSSQCTSTFNSGVCCLGSPSCKKALLSLWSADHLDLMMAPPQPSRYTDLSTPNDLLRTCHLVSSESILHPHCFVVTAHTDRR